MIFTMCWKALKIIRYRCMALDARIGNYKIIRRLNAGLLTPLESLAALTNEQEQVRESNVASISKSFFVVKNFIDYSSVFPKRRN